MKNELGLLRIEVFACLQVVSNVGRKVTCLANVQMGILLEEEAVVVVGAEVRIAAYHSHLTLLC